MKRVLTAVVLIPLVLLVVFKAPLWLFALVVAAILVLALHEYLAIMRGYGVEPLRLVTYVMGVVVVLATLAAADDRIWMKYPLVLFQLPWLFRVWSFFLILPLIFGIPLVFRREMAGALPAVAGSSFGVLYLAASLALLIPMRQEPIDNVLIIFILLSVWAGDSAAYYVGRSIGRHKLAPVVSPKKTWEGAIASVLASVFVSWLIFHFQTEIRNLFSKPQNVFYIPLSAPVIRVGWAHIIILGVLTNIAAQFGDLFESALKRGAHIKDSGSLLPGHGGILDRIDALLFAIPVVWYYASFTGFLQQ